MSKIPHNFSDPIVCRQRRSGIFDLGRKLYIWEGIVGADLI